MVDDEDDDYLESYYNCKLFDPEYIDYVEDREDGLVTGFGIYCQINKEAPMNLRCIFIPYPQSESWGGSFQIKFPDLENIAQEKLMKDNLDEFTEKFGKEWCNSKEVRNEYTPEWGYPLSVYKKNEKEWEERERTNLEIKSKGSFEYTIASSILDNL